MKFKRCKQFLYTESSASSDIAFLLIIYFIVIAGFNINQGFLMNLPLRDSTRLILKDDLLKIEMNDIGELYHEGVLIDRSEAEIDIYNLSIQRPNFALFLTIHPMAPWQEVVSFVEMVQRLEVNSFSFNMKEI